ncbi:MAG: PhoPQ-activated pathogenicity-related family protein [Bacteroidales bacterium]|nr:PhoPQ-activated pathogenicity-related family protein [Bacteroidales bacterium]
MEKIINSENYFRTINQITMKKHLIISYALLLGLTACSETKSPVTPETALQSYLKNKDKSFSWEVKEKYETDGLLVADLKLTSQEWRGISWNHQLTVISPAECTSDGALLFINSGSNKDGMPNWKGKDDGLLKMLAIIAAKNKAVVAVISQVPNQPLYDDLYEDALISFTLDNFKNDRDFTWPLLFPMTKSAIRAMDAVQQYSKKELKHRIKRFVVSGASKRGWTTWLAGSQDPRITAIAPMVIDVLNMPVNIAYQKEAWGDYSIQIEDYVKLGIAQDLGSADGNDLVTMIDPYSYRTKLDMPKMIIMGTNDEYWTVDAIKNYFYDIPGENYIHYEPNVGHNLGGGRGAMQTLSAFFNIVINNKQHPDCNWIVNHDSTKTVLEVKASPELKKATLWICDSPDQDFRDNKFVDQDILIENPSEIIIQVDHPVSGFRAFYLELTYPDPVEGTYSKCTRMFVAGKDKLYLN